MLYKGSLFIISAPSGTGKTSLLTELVKKTNDLKISVSYTTRARRSQEIEAENYHFIDLNKFKEMVKKDLFLESAEVFNHYYGTSKEWVENTLQAGFDVVLEIDWQGARQVRVQYPEAQSIFILPPSRESLFERLQKRHSDKETVIEDRYKKAKEEISHYNEYDYLICNDRFEEALEELTAVIYANRLQWRHQEVRLKSLLEKLLSD